MVNIIDPIIDRFSKQRPIERKRMKLSIFTTGINASRKIGDKLLIEHTPAKAFIQKTLVNADNDRAKSLGKEFVYEDETVFVP